MDLINLHDRHPGGERLFSNMAQAGPLNCVADDASDKKLAEGG